MSRLERQTESVERLADAVGNFRRSIVQAPPYGTPRTLLGNGRASMGDILLVDTSGGKTVEVQLPEATPLGHGVTVVNDGDGSVRIVCPAGGSLLSGSTSFLLAAQHMPNFFVAITKDRYMKFPSEDGGGTTYVDRGDPSADDFTTSNLTIDGSSHDLDLSSIVPVEAAGQLVHMRIRHADSAARNFIIYKKGQSNLSNGLWARSIAAGSHIDNDGTVQCDENRVVRYIVGTSAGSSDPIATVRGWWVPV